MFNSNFFKLGNMSNFFPLPFGLSGCVNTALHHIFQLTLKDGTAKSGVPIKTIFIIFSSYL